MDINHWLVAASCGKGCQLRGGWGGWVGADVGASLNVHKGWNAQLTECSLVQLTVWIGRLDQEAC